MTELKAIEADLRKITSDMGKHPVDSYVARNLIVPKLSRIADRLARYDHDNRNRISSEVEAIIDEHKRPE